MKTISSISKVIDSLHSTPNYVQHGYPMVRVQDIKNDFLDLKDALFVDQKSYLSYIKNHKPKRGDIVITRVGSYGMLALVEDDEDFCLGQNIAIISPEGDSRFLYYYLKSPYIQNFIYGNASGSAYKSLSLERIRNLPYIEPSSDPRHIGELLYTIDKTIELNRRINVELEQMARVLYDYWFVQFDFPDANGKPYKFSGGQMIYSDQLKRKIPEGWKALKLQDVLEFEKGTEPGAAAYSEVKGDEYDLPFYRVGDIDGETSTYIDSKEFKAKIVKPTDVIVTFDGSVGKMGLGLEGAISGGLRHIYDKTGRISDAGVYAIFRDEYVAKTIERYATGSVILHASSSIPYLYIPYDENTFAEFQKIIKPMFAKIIANRQESQKLAHLRDWLLPMLMKGQVSVQGNVVGDT